MGKTSLFWLNTQLVIPKKRGMNAKQFETFFSQHLFGLKKISGGEITLPETNS